MREFGFNNRLSIVFMLISFITSLGNFKVGSSNFSAIYISIETLKSLATRVNTFSSRTVVIHREQSYIF